MKLFNKTNIPDDLLKAVIYRAAKAVGSVRTSEVVVKVTTAQYGSHGCVEHHKTCRWGYYLWFLEGCRSNKPGKNKLVYSDGGFVFLKISANDFRRDPLAWAEGVYALAAHEWQHIKDSQKGVSFDTHRKHWKNRSHEKRAMVAANRAVRTTDRDSRISDAILDLALFMEEAWKPKKEEWDRQIAECRRRG